MAPDQLGANPPRQRLGDPGIVDGAPLTELVQRRIELNADGHATSVGVR